MNRKYFYMYLRQTLILFLLSYILCIGIGTVQFLHGSEVMGASALMLFFFGLGNVLGIWNSGKTEHSVRDDLISVTVFYALTYLLMECVDRHCFHFINGILPDGIALFLRVVVTSSHILIYPLLLTAGYYLMSFLCVDRRKRVRQV